jgi:ribosomal protein L16 Arg81 hydroxylase
MRTQKQRDRLTQILQDRSWQQMNVHIWRSKLELAQETIQSLQDKIAASYDEEKQIRELILELETAEAETLELQAQTMERELAEIRERLSAEKRIR